MTENNGSLKAIIALKFACCGALILFLYGGLNFGALAAWAALNGIWWGAAIALSAMVLLILAYIRRHRARPIVDNGEIGRNNPPSRPVGLSS